MRKPLGLWTTEKPRKQQTILKIPKAGIAITPNTEGGEGSKRVPEAASMRGEDGVYSIT